MVENQTCKQNKVPPPNPPPSSSTLNAPVIPTEVILMDYNIYILDAFVTGRHNPPAISIALENSREFRDNIVVLSFRSVYVSKTFTELVQVRD